jgi:phage gpG-like protein
LSYFKLSVNWNKKQFNAIDTIFKAHESISKDLSNLWAYLLPTMFENFKEVWKIGQREWPGLSDKYFRWKVKHFPRRGILELTLDLKNALTKQTGNTINIVEPLRWIFGYDAFSIPYGIYHDSEEPRKSNLPRREFMYIPKNVFRRFHLRTKKWLYLQEKRINASNPAAGVV